MRRSKFLQFLTAGLLTAALTAALSSELRAQGKPPFDVGAAAAGEQSYRTYCAACHGKTAKGDGPLAKDLKVPPANLTQIAKRHNGEYPFDMVVQTIDGRKPVPGHGTQEMPAWGQAFRTTDNEAQAMERMKQLAHFLWSVQEKPQSP
jgi:mono/diheme cytochrome c family protein